MKKEEITEYFIEPIGGETNGRLFRDVLKGRDEDVCEEHMCADGIVRNLLRVSIEELAMCIINRRTSELTFNSFKRTEKGIERIYIVFKDDVVRALKGKVSFDEAGITHEKIMELLPKMPLIPSVKQSSSSYGVLPLNVLLRRKPRTIHNRFSKG